MTFCSCCERDECSVHFTGLLWWSISEFLFPSHDLQEVVRLKAVSAATSITPFKRILLPAFFWQLMPLGFCFEGIAPAHKGASLCDCCTSLLKWALSTAILLPVPMNVISFPILHVTFEQFCFFDATPRSGEDPPLKKKKKTTTKTNKKHTKPLSFISFSSQPLQKGLTVVTLVCRLSPYHLLPERCQSQKWVMFHSVYRNIYLRKPQTWIRI